MGTLTAFEQSLQITGAASQADQTIQAHFSAKKAYRDTMAAIAPIEWLVPEDDETLQQAEGAISETVEANEALSQVSQVAEVAGQVAEVDAPNVAA